MIVYPAIDIREGRVVRLLHGNPDLESVYGTDPVEVAKRWQAAGAQWVHIVNLDGALEGGKLASQTLMTIHQIAETGLLVQFGGGLRSLNAIEQALKFGAKRAVLGTLVVREPEMAAVAVKEFGSEAVVVALDAKGEQVALDGWQETSSWTTTDLGKRFAADGVQHALYTDVSKDGALSGVNIEATAALAEKTGLQVIASGGVAQLAEIEALKATEKVAGVVIGRALYAELMTLEDALRVAES